MWLRLGVKERLGIILDLAEGASSWWETPRWQRHHSRSRTKMRQMSRTCKFIQLYIWYSITNKTKSFICIAWWITDWSSIFNVGQVENYETGDLQGDEIERVLSLLFMEIDYSLYGNNTYTYENEQVHEFKPKPWHRNLRQGHKKTFCQACSNKVCNKFYRTRCTEPANITDPVLNESDKRLSNPSVRDWDEK